MPKLEWERVVETCVKNRSSAVLIDGYPMFIRSDGGLRAAVGPSLDLGDVALMVGDLEGTANREDGIGFRYLSFRHGRQSALRAAVFGSPAPNILLLQNVPDPMPQLPQEAGVGHANAGGLPWNRILARCHGPVQDVVLVPGCAPLLWSYVGLHSFLVPALTADKIASMVGEIVQPPGLTVRVDGYLGFDVRFGADVQFRVAVFGEPSPSFVIVMRLPAKVADRVPGRP